MALGRSIMVSAFVIGVSTRRSAAFAQRGLSPRLPSRSSSLQVSFFDDLAQNFQRAFSSDSSGSSEYYTVGITGSSGLVGSALIDQLSRQETLDGRPVRIVKLKRSDATESKPILQDKIQTLAWNPNGQTPEEVIDLEALSAMDAIVHLAGENVSTGRGLLGFTGIQAWSKEKMDEIMNSRVGPTEALSKAINACKTPTAFLVASAVGAYGPDFIGPDVEAVDESADVSDSRGFLAEVARSWEAASKGVDRNRVVNCRLGVVVSKRGGILQKLFPIFFLGGGGNVGSGQQYLSFISARDTARAFAFLLEDSNLSGPVNVCAPVPCTNEEFTRALGRQINRPTILPLPGFVVSLLFGQMGDEMLLGGIRAEPGRLVRNGFEFQHPTIDEAIESALTETV